MYLGKDFEKYLEESNEIGFVETLNFPLVGVSGLPGVFLGEVVIFEVNKLGLVFSLDEGIAHILLLEEAGFSVGDKVTRTRQTLQVSAYPGLMGGAYDCLGKSLFAVDSLPEESQLMPVFSDAPDFALRERVQDPLETGVAVVDLMVPLGKGQRELVLGDRKSGKTEFLLQTILSQARMGTICIYAGIGKNKSELLDILDFSKDYGIEDSLLVVGTSSSDSPGEIYLTPYTAMAFAEYFRDKGKDVLLILDDMTSHAKYYRELSLIAGSFPGRGSYPGDIFFVHSQLLERAGNFKVGDVSHSITCLPVAETVGGDISGYIQTNLMSMTDGHVFFDEALFDEGQRPAVNTFLSVTRVGRQVQSNLHKSLNRELTGFLNLLRKHERFVHFGAELSEGIRTTLETGAKVKEFFNQPPRMIYPLNIQYLLFTLIWGGLLTIHQRRSLKFLGEKLSDMYTSDSDFRQYVDNLIVEDSEFNDLLSKVVKNKDNIKEVIGVTL